jgi:hypothetical protein
LKSAGSCCDRSWCALPGTVQRERCSRRTSALLTARRLTPHYEVHAPWPCARGGSLAFLMRTQSFDESRCASFAAPPSVTLRKSVI